MRKKILAFFCFTTPFYPILLFVMCFGEHEFFWQNSTAPTFFFLGGYYYVLWEFYQCHEITEDDKLFWSHVTNAIILPVAYFKIINAEQQAQAQVNQLPEKQRSPTRLPPLNHGLALFFCFAIPLYLLSFFFGLTPYLQMLGQGIQYLRIFLLAGFFYVMITFWSSARFTNDDKLFWSIGVLFSLPLGLPLLYVKKIRPLTEIKK